jgi:hypothetical protein
VRENLTLTPNPSPKGEGKNGAAQRYVAWFGFLGGNIKLTHYLRRRCLWNAAYPCYSLALAAPGAMGVAAARRRS